MDMGASLSVVSVSTTLLINVGSFALGYVLADVGRRRNAFLFLEYWARSFAARAGLAVSPVSASAATVEPRNAEESKQKNAAFIEIESLSEIIDDFKMVLVVRNDLKMGKGKIAAQCSHASLGLYKKLLHKAPKSLSRWEDCGQVKVVLGVESEEDLLVLQESAKSLMLPTHITIDAGRTQIAADSRTVLSILGPADLVDDVTGELKLL